MTVLDIVIEGKDNASDELKGVDSALGNLGSKAGGIAAAGLGIATGAVLAIGAAAVGTAVAAVNLSSDIQNATNNIAAQMGISQDSAAGFEGVMKGIFANNFGENFDDIGAAIVTVSQSLGDMPDEALQGITEDAFAMRDAFGMEVTESVTGAKSLMEAFGLSGEQAMDFIASGMQNGLNASGDFVESIGEYGNLFAEAGFSAEEMYNIMESGAQAGILGTDKIADAVKEMGIILNEGGDDTKAAFDTIGLSFDDIAASVADGSADWGDYFNDIVGGLNDIEDPMARSQAQVAIFGTMAEDLGVSFTEGLSSAGIALDDMSEATENLNAQYDNFPAMFEGFKRSALLALEPLGDILLEIGNLILPIVQAGFEWFSDNVGPIIGRVVDVLRGLITSVQDSGDAVGGLIDWVKGLLLQFGFTEEAIDTVITIARTLADVLQQYLGNSINNLKLLVGGFKAAFEGDFRTLGTNVVAIFENTLNMLVNVLGQLWSLIQPVLSSMWSKFSAWFANMDWQKLGHDVVKAIIDGLKTFVSTVGPILASWDKAFWQWFGNIDWAKIGYDIVKAIIGALKFFVNEVIPTLMEWAGAFISWVGDQDWPAIGLAIVEGIINGVTNAASALYEAVRNMAAGAWQAIKEEMGIESPAKVMIPLGAAIVDGLVVGIEDNAGKAVDVMTELGESMTAEMVSMVASIIAVIGPMMSALRMLASFNIDSAALFAKLDDFGQLIYYLGRVFASAGWQLVYTNRQEAVNMAKAVEPIAKAVVEAIGAFSLLAEAQFPPNLVNQIDLLIGHIQLLIVKFGELSDGMTDRLSQEIINLANAAIAVSELIKPAIDGMTTLAETDFGEIVQGMHLADQIDTFMRIIRTLVLRFLEAALLLNTEMSEQVSAFASAAGAVVGLIEEAIEGVKKLSEVSFGDIVQGMHLAEQIQIFRNIIRTIMREFAEAAAEMDSELSNAISDFANAAGAIFELIENAIVGVTMLSETNFGDIVRGMHLADQIVIFRNIVRTLIDRFTEVAADMTGELSEQVRNFADATSAITGFIAPAIEALAALSEYTQQANLEVKIKEFTDDLMLVITALVNGFNSILPDIEMAMEDAAAIANAINSIIAVIIPGLEAMTGIAEWVRDKEVRLKVDIFIEDLIGIVSQLINGFKLAFRAFSDMSIMVSFVQSIAEFLDLTNQIVASIAGLVDNLEAAIENLKRLATMDVPGGISDIMAGAIQKLKDAIPAAATAGYDFGMAWVDGVREAISSLSFDTRGGAGGGGSVSLAGAAAGVAGSGGLTTNINLGGLTFNTTVNNQMDEDELHFRIIETIRGLVQ